MIGKLRLPAAIVFLVLFSVSCKTIAVQNYEINSPKISKDNGIRIVVVSDLHSSIFRKNQAQLIDAIKACEPDLIFLPGDLFDHRAGNKGAELLLQGISDLAPVYFVAGNHEYWSGNIHKLKNLLLYYNVNILSDSYVKTKVNNEEILIAGIEDPDKGQVEKYEYNQDLMMESRFRELDEIELFKILIAHRPEYIANYSKFSFDLVVSGHTHGGVIRLPFSGKGLYASNQGFFPKYSGGLYKSGNTTLIISRGLSFNRPALPRLFNKPELVVIILESE